MSAPAFIGRHEIEKSNCGPRQRREKNQCPKMGSPSKKKRKSLAIKNDSFLLFSATYAHF